MKKKITVAPRKRLTKPSAPALAPKPELPHRDMVRYAPCGACGKLVQVPDQVTGEYRLGCRNLEGHEFLDENREVIATVPLESSGG